MDYQYSRRYYSFFLNKIPISGTKLGFEFYSLLIALIILFCIFFKSYFCRVFRALKLKPQAGNNKIISNFVNIDWQINLYDLNMMYVH